MMRLLVVRLVGLVIKMSLSRVADIGNVSIITIHNILDSLDTAVREGNMVDTAGMLAITLLVMAKVSSMVVIMYFVAIGIMGRLVVRPMVFGLVLFRKGTC